MCLHKKKLLPSKSIYDIYCHKSYKNDAEFDLLKIASIVNEINNNTYNYNYPIIIWDDGTDEEPDYDTDANGSHQIRAFYYCKKNIFMAVNRSG